jgi:hypothetical protein
MRGHEPRLDDRMTSDIRHHDSDAKRHLPRHQHRNNPTPVVYQTPG